MRRNRRNRHDRPQSHSCWGGAPLPPSPSNKEVLNAPGPCHPEEVQEEQGPLSRRCRRSIEHRTGGGGGAGTTEQEVQEEEM